MFLWFCCLESWCFFSFFLADVGLVDISMLVCDGGDMAGVL
jgi:hypothetical protein